VTRLEALVALAHGGGFVVDIGADHGRVAAALGAVAVERMPHRVAGTDASVRWVVSDGLTAFRQVDGAVIAGMGARRIAAILTAAPRPGWIVAHADDEPGWLRRWLAEHGWAIEEEDLVLEKGRFHAMLRASAGIEPATGDDLEIGPRLIERRHPLLAAWLDHERALLLQRASAAQASAPARADALQRRADAMAEVAASLRSPGA
jgi:tRNA (adenine22-N1)-methyltransferase